MNRRTDGRTDMTEKQMKLTECDKRATLDEIEQTIKEEDEIEMTIGSFTRVEWTVAVRECTQEIIIPFESMCVYVSQSKDQKVSKQNS